MIEAIISGRAVVWRGHGKAGKPSDIFAAILNAT